MQIIADNINIMNPRVARALESLDPEPVRTLARECAAGGADAVDINPGPVKKQRHRRMQLLIEAVQEAADLPLWLDSNDPELVRIGLDLCRRPPVINGFSLEPSRLENMLPLAVETGCRIVGFLLKADGHVPPTLSERLETFQDLYEQSLRSGLDPGQLIVDPISVPLMWEDGSAQGQAVLETVAHLPQLAGHPVETVVGLSNLTSSSPPSRSRAVVEPAYLAMLSQAGLNRVMLDIRRREAVAAVKFRRELESGGVLSWAELDAWLNPAPPE
jgi:5-methyltetrahydrofolate corrinoid/iron sulfur protein methyltransferase